MLVAVFERQQVRHSLDLSALTALPAALPLLIIVLI
jgi:hypothetical protein